MVRTVKSCGEHLLTLPDIAGEHRFADHPQIKPCLVASDLPVKWRITIDEGDPETKLIGVKISRRCDVSNEQLCFG